MTQTASGPAPAQPPFVRLGSFRDVGAFRDYLARLGLSIPCDAEIESGPESPLARPMTYDGKRIGNRIVVHPMEGWDGTADGRPGEATFRRWRRFGQSGAKLIWGGEAVAVRHDGRANPNQLVINEETKSDLARLREKLIDEHRKTTGSDDGLVIGLQLTHSGRYSVPNVKGRPEPRTAMRHPILDRRQNIATDERMFTDDEVRRLIEDFHSAAKIAADVGYDFVDVKHCHGYLGHEFLGAHTRPGAFGGSFENRTRFLREVVAGIRAQSPLLDVGVRLSCFDMVPFRPDPDRSKPGRPGPGIPEPFESLVPYRWGFGVNANNPTEVDLTEPAQFLALLRDLGIRLVNLTAGSPYYNPHIQRPAYYPPSDGYLPPEDPLVGVARQMHAVRTLKRQFPDLLIVGTAYSYLQEFLPNVAQAAVREGWVDAIGLGRVILSYPAVLWDAAQGNPQQSKKLCRTFSDCTTAPRNGLPSGCYPLDEYYKDSELMEQLKAVKAGRKKG
jgi:2,4-dienoyl-CoA reductase-like NADH-dependent reductase (Old Yellow Enzyme family)